MNTVVVITLGGIVNPETAGVGSTVIGEDKDGEVVKACIGDGVTFNFLSVGDFLGIVIMEVLG